MENEKKMDVVINLLLMELEDTAPGSEEYKKISDDLAKLYRVRSDEEAKFREAQARQDQNDINEKIRREELRQEKKFNWLRFGKDVGEVVLMTGMTAFLAMKGFKFEETGSISSSTFRNIFGKAIRFKK